MPRGRRSPKLKNPFAVKVYVNSLQHDFRYPWRAPKIDACTGSGFVIEGNKIITNAHVVGGAVFIEVQLANDPVKYVAKLSAIGNDCDLAQLEVESEEFWQKAQAIPVGKTPQQTQKVWVHGFPVGGEGYCITDGIVSRHENDTYVHGEHMLLSTQVSAAINPGNSGGAVVSNGKVVGVVHQGISGRQNIGYMIPATVLSHFIQQVENKNFGFPTLDLSTQKLENAYLRADYKMIASETGILIRDVPKLSCANGILMPNDIILAVDGYTVGNDGTIDVKDLKHVDYNYLLNNKKIGDEITFKILRDGQLRYETVKLNKAFDSSSMILPRTWGVEPTYYVIRGGVVVQPVSKNYIQDTNKHFGDKEKENPDDELIVINTILQNEYTQGYKYSHALIDKINGVKVNNMKAVISAIEEHQGPTHIIELQSGARLVLPRLSSDEADRILASYQIPKDRSADLAKLKSKPASGLVRERRKPEEKAASVIYAPQFAAKQAKAKAMRDVTSRTLQVKRESGTKYR